ncbi:unnamed protein product [Dimorphilus gyrociliatus]|uniref:Uncharacterized protein n=1 Tax=Dimorphilus gyrociliatus TaxID=2664684 RepID=A0A7I8VD43_9ANNE|nr:unnamed protein product [Dimorphilus gyrociliatus]
MIARMSTAAFWILIIFRNFIDLFGDLWLRITGVQLFTLTVDSVYKGLPDKSRAYLNSDIVGKHVIESISRLVSALNSCREVSTVGRFILHRSIVEGLRRRADLVECLKSNPEILAVKISRPVFIVSMPRTASTFLHCSMQKDQRWLVPETWQLSFPTPPPHIPFTISEIKRIDEMTKQLKYSHLLAGEDMKAAHDVNARDPEDETIFLECEGVHNFLPQLLKGSELDSYAQWTYEGLTTDDWCRIYTTLKQTFQTINYHRKDIAGKRVLWVTHFPCLNAEALLQVFPDAQFITIHRDPPKLVNSISSLVCNISKQYKRNGDNNKVEIGKRLLKHMEKGIEMLMDFRERHSGESERFIDVLFEDLTKKPAETMKGIYRKLGENWNENDCKQLIEYVAEQKAHGGGRHKYSMTEFGLDFEEVRMKLKSYSRRFLP